MKNEKSKCICIRYAWSDDIVPAEQSRCPEIALSFENLLHQIKEEGGNPIYWANFKPDEMSLVLGIFIDPPAPEDPFYRFCLEKAVPYILIVTENLYLQPYDTYAELAKHSSLILTYESNPLYGVKTRKLRYPVLHENSLVLRQEREAVEKQYLIGMINTYKKGKSPGDIYNFRNDMALYFAKKLKGKFGLYGIWWENISVYSKKWQRSLAKRMPRLAKKILSWPNESCLGYLPPGLTAKYDFFSKCEFGVALENNNSIGGYITEKIFNVLIGGAIPIYVGPPDVDTELPPDIYLDAKKFPSNNALLQYIITMPSAEKKKLRHKGLQYLQSAEAQKFSSRAFVTTIMQAIRDCQTGAILE